MSSTHTHGPERHPQIPTQSPTYTDSTRFRFHDSQRQNHSWSKMPVQLVGLSSTLVLWPPLPLALWLTSCAPGTVGGGRKEAMPPALSALASDGDAAAVGVGVGGTAVAGCGVDCPAPMPAACWVCRYVGIYVCVGYSERRSREMGGLRHVVLKGRHQPSGRSIDRLIEPNTQIDRSSDPWVDWGTRWASWGRSHWASQAGSSSEGPKDTIDDGNSLSVRLGAIRPIRALRPRPQTPTWARVDPTATLNTTVARPWVGLDGRDRPGWARLGLGFRQYGRPATIDCTSSSPRCFTSPRSQF